MGRDDECEHGVEGLCMRCIREGENKGWSEPEPDPNAPKYPGDYEKMWWEDD